MTRPVCLWVDGTYRPEVGVGVGVEVEVEVEDAKTPRFESGRFLVDL